MICSKLNHFACAAAALFAISGVAHAELCPGVQKVSLTYGGNELAHWEGNSSQIHKLTLPNGFVLGVKTEQGAREIYERDFQRNVTQTTELVKISLYDYSAAVPRYLTSTWGGSQSRQGYGPKGGADRVDELGSGIVLNLDKPACTISKLDLAAIPTEKDLGQTRESMVPDEKTKQWMQAAQQDIAKKRYVVSMFKDSLPAEVSTRLAQLLNKDGIELELIQQGDAHDAKAYMVGYARTMQSAIEAQYGKEHGKNIERQLKAEFKL
ncbi:hypothetical protein H8L32_25395 [Undibacterium sp. CY18W]|uniref:Uncharacterized protein n=1 Tax=Undibacterium hunanense TaxID=2762292 RepID=A0ABR6ZY65_9BURK|nr:hypothetical protein [Undibacterium hunanense]MBC3920826.1 hypothetical protein [Undibacterium hunanense]